MTLKQEIENLIEEIESALQLDTPSGNWERGYNSGQRQSAEDLTDILSRHPEQGVQPTPPTAPSQRERIAMAIMLEMIRNSTTPDFMYATFASPAVTAADALIEELGR